MAKTARWSGPALRKHGGQLRPRGRDQPLGHLPGRPNRHRPLGEVVAELTHAGGARPGLGDGGRRVRGGRGRHDRNEASSILCGLYWVPACLPPAPAGSGGARDRGDRDGWQCRAADAGARGHRTIDKWSSIFDSERCVGLLPHDLATLAIVPLQIRIGLFESVTDSFTLDRGHVRGLLATAGVGLASQAVKGMARRFLWRAGRQLLAGGGGPHRARAPRGHSPLPAPTPSASWPTGIMPVAEKKMDSPSCATPTPACLNEGKWLFGQHPAPCNRARPHAQSSDVIDFVRNPQ